MASRAAAAFALTERKRMVVLAGAGRGMIDMAHPLNDGVRRDFAAAVAAGILPFAPGSDGGGSIRIPAAACGLVGLKPGRGELPMDEHADTVRNLTVSGPLAHTVEDAALLYDVLLSPEGLPGRVLPDLRRTVETARAGGAVDARRIGVTTASPFASDLEISLARPAVTALTKAAAALDAGGHAVEDLSPYYGEDYHRDFRTVWTSGLLRAPLPEDAEERVGAIAAHFLRPGDVAHLAELHPAEHEALMHVAGFATLHRQDGFQMAQAVCPPTPRRGLILIDPSYEVKADYAAIPRQIGLIARKWNVGVIALWYPILTDARHVPMLTALMTAYPDALRSEVSFPPARAGHSMIGSGLWVLNPPFGLDEEAARIEDIFRRNA